MNLRTEEIRDQPAIRSLVEYAFGRPDEADLVDRLRSEAVVLASIVAEVNDRVVGHALFSRVTIEGDGRVVSAVALAPVAVLPYCQRRGVGSALIRHGIDLLREGGEKIILVLGDPGYYPRFGFSCEKARLLETPFPRDAFMAMELKPGALNGVHGKVVYPAAFGL